MTAKEALRELVDEMSEEDARDALDILREMFQEPVSRPPVSSAELDSVRRGLEDLDAGRRVPHEEVKRRFGPQRWT